MRQNNIVKFNHSQYLSEVSRKNMVGKTKVQSPQRYRRKNGYFPKNYKGINLSTLLRKDEFVVVVPVGKYDCTIAYTGFLEELKLVIKSQKMPNVNLNTVIQALQRSIDKTDIKVNCTCPDFRYRFAYWATKFDYKYGKPEVRPSKITNPKDTLGATCKHLMAVLYNKRWLVKLATTLNDAIKQYTDDFRKAMGLSEDELIINGKGRPSYKNNKGTTIKKSTVVDDSGEGDIGTNKSEVDGDGLPNEE